MNIRIVQRGAGPKDRPFCPMLIDYPYEQPQGTQTADGKQ